MDGARLKDVLAASFFVAIFFPLPGPGVTLLMHNNDKMSRSFITKLVWCQRLAISSELSA
jgi:hypothetical protein